MAVGGGFSLVFYTLPTIMECWSQRWTKVCLQGSFSIRYQASFLAQSHFYLPLLPLWSLTLPADSKLYESRKLHLPCSPTPRRVPGPGSLQVMTIMFLVWPFSIESIVPFSCLSYLSFAFLFFVVVSQGLWGRCLAVILFIFLKSDFFLLKVVKRK